MLLWFRGMGITSSVILPNCSFFVRKRANERFAQKKSNSLIHTFLVSESLTVAHFWWGICSQSLFFGERSDRSSHRSIKKRDTSFLKLNKTYKKYDFVQIFWVNRSFFCEHKSNFLIKKGVICSGCSFVISILSDLLTVAHFW